MTNSDPFPASKEEFRGKRVLVTGGTKGAGKAIAERFLQGEGTVIVAARSKPVETNGAHFIQADVAVSDGTNKSSGKHLIDSRAWTSLSIMWADRPRRAEDLSL